MSAEKLILLTIFSVLERVTEENCFGKPINPLEQVVVSVISNANRVTELVLIGERR